MKQVCIFVLLLLIAMIGNAQKQVVSNSLSLKVETGKDKDTIGLRLVDQSGLLICYGNNKKGEYDTINKHLYRQVYYLFLDKPIIHFCLGSSIHENGFIDIETRYKGNKWVIEGKDCGPQTRIDSDILKKGLDLHWGKRAQLLIDCVGNKSDILLIVLPMPSEDRIITKFPYKLDVDKEKKVINGNVKIYRTGRIVFDSIYVNGEKAVPLNKKQQEQDVFFTRNGQKLLVSYHEGEHKKDTPFYNNPDNSYAQLELKDMAWDTTMFELKIKVFYTRFDKDGRKRDCSTITLPLNERFFFQKYWYCFLLLIAVVAFFILMNKGQKERPERGIKQKIKKAQSRIVEREGQIKNLKNKVYDPNKAIKKVNFEKEHVKKIIEEDLLRKNEEFEVYKKEDNTEQLLDICKEIQAEIERIRNDDSVSEDVKEEFRELEKKLILWRMPK